MKPAASNTLSRAGLVKAVVDVAIVGDDEPVPMLLRQGVRRIQQHFDLAWS